MGFQPADGYTVNCPTCPQCLCTMGETTVPGDTMQRDEIEQLVATKVAVELQASEQRETELRNELGRIKDLALAAQSEAKAASQAAVELQNHALTKAAPADWEKQLQTERTKWESMRQSVVDQQESINRHARTLSNHGGCLEGNRKSIAENTASYNRVRMDNGAHQDQIRVLTAQTAVISGRAESAHSALTNIQGAIGDMSDLAEQYDNPTLAGILAVMNAEPEGDVYEVSEETPAVEATPDNPALIDALKTAAGAAGQGVALGASAAFISQGTQLVLNKAVSMGMLSEEQAASTAMRNTIELALPFLLAVAAQYNWCPQREFMDKASKLALTGQSAEKSAWAMSHVMGFAVELLALPGAQGLKAQLEVAQ